MASHGSDTNKDHLFMSLPRFSYCVCLSVCLSFCLSYNIDHLLMSFPSLSFFSVCLSVKQRSFINELMSFPSFFFLFCLCVCVCVCLSVCLSNKGHLLMNFPSFWSARCVCVGGGAGGTPILGQ